MAIWSILEFRSFSLSQASLLVQVQVQVVRGKSGEDIRADPFLSNSTLLLQSTSTRQALIGYLYPTILFKREPGY
ncbi:hypothetical protein B0I72DRAFT_134808 [Yarrowia lipolytica]|uniref:Uncharacterized protein n=1 Tax=Yarrowia lipolytica TaxID=4952 RepID=A0A371C5W1_YARLL|nr:hypothetical protein BKA91DRAFT_133297 [Yarrowia lipolytica]KAE8175331.1 hypothetical protein BKA90DRAFT_132473 [Yarrowia lipolytica]RDW25707.1 hypothetical protein B0I71DRAFT_132057 [Yarrowia lipolytica]RDW34443.1 hypothetical protein B0I72DRAFT_134808 [Yarrowia lipolytica]RDW42126.1 hypothetical protein B0I73DRAFT_127408 [Yarrowia lipolytica]